MRSSKWITRGGMLLILLGFLLPSVVVSCSAFPGVSRDFSLLNLAEGSPGNSLLYIVPIGLLIAMMLSFLSVADVRIQKYLVWGQAVCIGAGLLSITLALIYLQDEIKQLGVFILLAGYILTAVGLFMEGKGLSNSIWVGAGQGVSVVSLEQPPPAHPQKSPEPSIQSDIGVPLENRGLRPSGPGRSAGYTPPFINESFAVQRSSLPPQPEPPLDRGGVFARLEPLRGGYVEQVVVINKPEFTIGRTYGNDLQVISDLTVSRNHVRLRFAGGVWYIQDLGSKSGVSVNGQRIPAGRLNHGDQIEIGKTTFIFRAR